ncbi:MAG TPA: UrcA family protein [Steroidobacteraceae bacterium]
MMTLRVGPTIARGGLLAAATLAAVSLARGAPAADTLPEPDDVPRVVVSFADLNLASPLDARRLLQRIAGAALQVCGDLFSSGDLRAVARERRCISLAIAQAVDTVASEKLTMVYDGSMYAPHRGVPLSPRAASIAGAPGRKGTQAP